MLKNISNKLEDIIGQRKTVSKNEYLRLAMKYLVLTFELQVYYHLSECINLNRVPRFTTLLGEAILDTDCDHDILLEFHPRLITAYRTCLSDLKCQEHIFSSDGNEIHVSPNSVCITQLVTEIGLVVSLFWENSYPRGLAAAHKNFQ